MDTAAQELDFAEQLAHLDINLLGNIESQTSVADRRSLLALHDACAAANETFEWLEIGSYLGGSLQALMCDWRCTRITSIDPRPPDQPDARDIPIVYEDNSTRRMLDQLATVPGAVLVLFAGVGRTIFRREAR